MQRLCVERMALGGQTAPGLQIKLPAMHCAGQDAILNLRKARQISLQVRTAALDAVTVSFPELLIRRW